MDVRSYRSNHREYLSRAWWDEPAEPEVVEAFMRRAEGRMDKQAALEKVQERIKKWSTSASGSSWFDDDDLNHAIFRHQNHPAAALDGLSDAEKWKLFFKEHPNAALEHG